MGGTLIAIFRAARAVYVILLLTGTLAFLFPSVGLREFLGDQVGENRLVELALGFVLFAVLVEHLSNRRLVTRQSHLAKALLRQQPEARREEAIRILIRALDSEDERVVGHAHRELKRLTQANLGRDPAEWRRWLKQQEQVGGSC